MQLVVVQEGQRKAEFGPLLHNTRRTRSARSLDTDKDSARALGWQRGGSVFDDQLALFSVITILT